MPEFEVELLRGPKGPPHVFSVMLAPGDPARRAEFLAAMIELEESAFLAELGEHVRSPRLDQAQRDGLLTMACRCATTLQRAEQLKPWADNQTRLGMLAGATLLQALTDAHKAPREASLLRARRDLERQRARGLSQRAQVTIWARMGAVAHLWAVFCQREIPGDPAALPAWLAVAESYRALGESFVPHRAREPVLDPASTWKAPASFPLPEVTIEYPD